MTERVIVSVNCEDPEGPDLHAENVTIANRGDTDLDLAGWTVRDAANHGYTFQDVVLRAGGSIRLWTRAGEDNAENVYWGRRWPVWNNAGDTAIVRDASGAEIARFKYPGGGWKPQSPLALAVDVAGFRYDPQQDIIYSKMYPLQRDFGYAYGYDAAAFAMNSIIDCEPIFFEYAGKTWMIELWKGQYGLETGCEIGVYNRTIGSTSLVYSILDATVGKRPGDPNPSHNLFFDCANDSERLLLSSTLYRLGERVLSRGPERHWWLTGFKWGLLSEPEDLTMDVSIECLDSAMTSAFVDALAGIGYREVQTEDNTVMFTFDAPKAHQPRMDQPELLSVVRAENEEIHAAYNSLGLSSNDPNTVGDEAVQVIARWFAIYGAEFFANAIAQLAKLFGVAVSQVLTTLTEEFRVALDAASQFVTNAGYTLAAWIGALENFIEEALNFSCVIEISNRDGPYELVREDYGVVHGDWVVKPPETIPPGGAGRFWLKDPKPSIYGAKGSASYSYQDSNGARQSASFNFDCPTGTAPNTAHTTSEAFNFYTKSGDINTPWGLMNRVVRWGHPLYVAFVWGDAQAPSDT